MAFTETRYLDGLIAEGSERELVDSSQRIELGSGKVVTIQRWSEPLWRYKIQTIPLTLAQRKTIEDLFAAGIYVDGFRFKDWLEYSTTGEVINAVSGSSEVWQLSYDTGLYTKTIKKPVDGTLTVYVSGEEKTEDTHYTVDYTTGLITWVSGEHPGSLEVTADFEWDIPVFIDQSSLADRAEYLNHGTIDLTLLEMRL